MRPDVALVGLGTDSDHALGLISAIVREAFCPVIALIPVYDAPWIEEAARRGIFAYIVDARPEEIHPHPRANAEVDVKPLDPAALKGALARGCR